MEVPAGFSQVTLDYQSDPATRGASVVFGVENVGSLSPDDIANDLEGGLLDDWVANTVSVHAGVVAIHVKNGPTATGPTADRSVSITGDVGGALMTPNVTILHKKVTASGGRKHRGRMFTPYTSEDVVAGNGFVDGTHRAAIDAANLDLLAALFGADLPMVLLHSGVEAPDTVTALLVQEFVATQRRRLRG